MLFKINLRDFEKYQVVLKYCGSYLYWDTFIFWTSLWKSYELNVEGSTPKILFLHVYTYIYNFNIYYLLIKYIDAFKNNRLFEKDWKWSHIRTGAPANLYIFS